MTCFSTCNLSNVDSVWSTYNSTDGHIQFNRRTHSQHGKRQLPNQCHWWPPQPQRTGVKLTRPPFTDLVIASKVDIKELSYKNTDAVQAQYFLHWTVHNFLCIFQDFSRSFDLEEGLIGARCADKAPCKMRCLFDYECTCLTPNAPSPSTPPVVVDSGNDEKAARPTTTPPRRQRGESRRHSHHSQWDQGAQGHHQDTCHQRCQEARRFQDNQWDQCGLPLNHLCHQGGLKDIRPLQLR